MPPVPSRGKTIPLKDRVSATDLADVQHPTRWLSAVWNGGLDPETADALDLHRRRTTVLAVCAVVPVGVADTVVSLTLGDATDAIGVGIGIGLALVLLAAQTAWGWARLAAHGMTAALYLAVFLAMADGSFTHTSWAWAVAVPALATLLRGWRATALWTPITLATLTFVFMPAMLGGSPELPPDEALHFTLEATLLLLCVNAPIVVASEMWSRAQRAAQQATTEALQSSEARATFVATMSHELRTPMNGVLGAAQLLRATRLTPEQASLLDVIEGSGDVLMDVINDVLDVARIDSGRLTTESIPVALRPLLEQVALSLRTKAQGQQVQVLVELDPDLPDHVLGDPTRLRQILFNLGGNAVKFTEQGQVVLRARAQGERLLLQVEDTGIGIAEDVLPTLFERFTQADATTSRRFGGTGLGLAIVTGLARALGGSVSATSEVGVGSCFTVELPLVQAHVEPSESPQVGPALASELHVLIADDNPVNRMVARGLLQRLGHQVVEVEDGAQALEAVEQAAPETFDVVLLDVHMPVLGGLEAARAIRALPDARSEVPLVALTADAMPQHRQEALEAGMDAHLSKPVRLQALDAVLAEVTGTAHSLIMDRQAG